MTITIFFLGVFDPLKNPNKEGFLAPFVFRPFLNIPCHIALRFCEKHVSYWQKREQSIKKNHDEKKRKRENARKNKNCRFFKK